ncbi:PQQ-dependent sugar dehydrogenase [Tautonia sp. JC769]|uniref:PQQ-dependent sugar dehydrogenase n=1 Tax=Tautonia sp. JC769 TaxID=3232135 RepID=UPI003459A8E7
MFRTNRYDRRATPGGPRPRRRLSRRVALEALEPRTLLTTLPEGFILRNVASELSNPTGFAFGPEGTFYLSEQYSGRIQVVQDGQLQPDPLITLPVGGGGERGLGGFLIGPPPAAHDDGDGHEHDHGGVDSNAYLYVYYTVKADAPFNRLSRFQLGDDGRVAGSEQVLLELPPHGESIMHFGGGMAWGEDGKLYLSIGDHTQSELSQDLDSLFGKVLRLNPDGSIPEDNPFYDQLEGDARSIWASGLRNPFKMHFDEDAGGLLIFDVGEASWEEVNLGSAGADYGWPAAEGVANDLRFVDPIYTYSRSGPLGGCSVINGGLYPTDAGAFPGDLQGSFFLADYCNGIRRVDLETGEAEPFATDLPSIVDLKINDAGEFYVLTYWDENFSARSGALYAVEFASEQEPSIVIQPESQVASLGGSATFSVTPTGSTPYAFQWLRDGEALDGATLPTLTLENLSLDDDGASFQVIVSNAFGSVSSDAVNLSVLAFEGPTIDFVAPGLDTRYNAGDTLAFEASAVDGLGEPIPAEGFQWWIDFHHDTHSHPFLTPTAGITSGSEEIPTTGETSPNVWFRVHLRVEDQYGLVTETFRDVHPNTANVTLQTSPGGGGMTLDGRPLTAPQSFQGVTGVRRNLGVPETLERDGVSWVFDSWSDGRAPGEALSTPSGDLAVTAIYGVDGGTIGEGQGILASYYDDDELSALLARRVEPAIAADLITRLPAWPEGRTPVAARWEGTVLPQFDELTSFYVTTSGGIRLWVGDDLLIDQWDNQSPAEFGTIPVYLTVGDPVTFRLEARDPEALGPVALHWISDSIPRSIVPSRQLNVPAGVELPFDPLLPSPGDPLPEDPDPEDPLPEEPEPEPEEPTPPKDPEFFDFDGDGLADRVAYDPETATWIITHANGETITRRFGAPGDLAIPGDYDGDGTTDLAVFRPESDLLPGAAHWFAVLSGGGVIARPFGAAGDLAVPGDYDGDGTTDLAVFRPESDLLPGAAHWFASLSGGGVIARPFGAAGDVAVPGDYDGDGTTDLAVFRPESDLLPGAAHWFASLSGGGVIARPFGAAGDLAVPGDYDGDGTTDLAVFRPESDLESGASHWFVSLSGGGVIARPFGEPGDVPAPGDYDGGRVTRLATFRPESRQAFLLQSSDEVLDLAFEDVSRRTRLLSKRWLWFGREGDGLA